MSTATRSRWIDWKPKARILADSAESEPTKPTKPGSEGFEGAISAESPEIQAGPNPAELAHKSAVLNRAGVRIMALEGGATIGMWSDLDGPEVRAALRTFGPERLPLRYLDGAGVPARYKVRRVEGEPVPMNVLAEMERRQADLMEASDPMETSAPKGGPMEHEYPWIVRDRMLNEMGWCPKGITWAEWKAATLNRLFQEQGATGKPGRITAATVRHGDFRRLSERIRATESTL
jgi:hypothetical protein